MPCYGGNDGGVAGERPCGGAELCGQGVSTPRLGGAIGRILSGGEFDWLSVPPAAKLPATMTLNPFHTGALASLVLCCFASAEIDFSHEVLPILKAHCAKCDSNGKYKGSLSMDTREALLDSDAVVVGNAAEHSTAILMAMKNRMDLAIGVAIGSSVQVALFVAPVLVFASYFLAEKPMDLVFSPLEVLAIVATLWITEQVISDGESNWLEGFQLLALYLIIGAMFYLLPMAAAVAH